MIDLTTEQPLSIKAVCEKFGVSRGTVRNWFNSGLERTKVGGNVFTTLEAIQRFSQPDDCLWASDESDRQIDRDLDELLGTKGTRNKKKGRA